VSHRILVIDHNPQGLERVVGPLRSAGYEVAIARTAADGASSFGHFEPDLVFIAARLPRTHGTVLCRELKRTGAGVQTPIVLIVEGTGVEIDLPPLDQFGADRLLQKPVGSEEILTVCCELLQPAGQPVESLAGGATGDAGVNYADDGLSTALEELDALEFDLPESFLRGVPGETAAANTVPVSDEHAEDISNHIDDLFGGGPTSSPTPANAGEPSTGQDLDVEEAVLDDLDIDNEINMRQGRNNAPPPPQRRASDQPADKPPTSNQPAPRPAQPPRSPSATLATPRPAAGSAPVVGRFQTEALTRKAEVPQPAPPAKDSTPVPPRWIWGAIPVTVAVVALAVFFMSRPASAPEQVAVVMAPVDSTDSTEPSTAATPFLSLMELPVASGDAFIESGPLESAPHSEPLDAPEPTLAEAQPRKSPTPKKVPVEVRPLAEPEPEPEPVTQPEPSGVIEEPLPAPRPEEQASPEPIVEDVPESAPETALAAEPEQIAEPVPAPITRPANLLHRVEPRVAPRDLKRGRGTVVLKVRVGKSGAVSRVIVNRGLPQAPALEGAAVAAVLRWRYEPALEAGEPVESWATAEFTFGD
jgi:protein TonB